MCVHVQYVYVNAYVSVSFCVCVSLNSSTESQLLNKYSRRSWLEMVQERHHKEKERQRKMSNKLTASNSSVYLSEFTHDSLWLYFLLLLFVCVCICVYGCVSTSSRFLVWHVYACMYICNIVLFSRLLYMLSVGVPNWKCKGMYTCSISVVNLGWPICLCWYIFQSVCLVLFSYSSYCCCLSCD